MPSSEATNLPWYALKVRTLSESKAAVALRTRGYDPFCPMYPERRRYCDRIKIVERALFPGYLFCRFDFQKKLPIVSSEAVEYIVGVNGSPAQIPDTEIASIHRAAQAGAQPAPYLKAKQRVRVQFGPFAGMEGVLVHDAGKRKLIVSLEPIQGAISVHINEDQVCPV